MATTSTRPAGEKIQAWLPVELADRLRKQAEAERRSVSSAVRNAVEDQLGRKGTRR